MPTERHAQFRMCPDPEFPNALHRIYEHAQCRVFERTSLQRAYVIPRWQQMGSSPVPRARHSTFWCLQRAHGA